MFASLTWKTASLVVAAPDDLLAAATRLLGLRHEPLPGDATAPPDVSVAASDGGYRLKSPTENCTETCREDAVMKLVALLSFHLLERAAATVLHAGSFLVGGEAVLFCGEQRAGKSSLALAAWQAGYPLLGDDWTVLHPDGTASAFPKPLKARLATHAVPAELAASLPPGDHLVASLGNELRLALGRRLPGMVGLDAAAPVTALFYLERCAGPTRIRPEQRDAALLAVLTHTLRTRGSRLGAVVLLERLRREGRVFRLSIGENDVGGALARMTAASDAGGATRDE